MNKNDKLYKFINEIIKKARTKGLSVDDVNERIDIIIESLKLEDDMSSVKKLALLKKYIPGILNNQLSLYNVFEIITYQCDNDIVTDEKDKTMIKKYQPPVVNVEESQYFGGRPIASCMDQKTNSRCAVESSSGSSCGSSVGNSRCAVESSSGSSCGSSVGNSRC